MNRRDPESKTAPALPARELFEQASRRLDPGTATRLRDARRAALAGPGRRPAPAWGLPAGAFAAAVLALGLAWWWPGHPAGPSAPLADAPGPAELEALLDEEPEFYAWLADAPVAMNEGVR